MDKKDLDFEQSFDINQVSFGNVSHDFENKFRDRYQKALTMMSDSRDRFMNLNGANALGVLEKMAQHMDDYDKKSDFEDSYHQRMKEYESFTET